MSSVRPLVLRKPGDLQALAALFDAYRDHYGEALDPQRSTAWLAHVIESGRLNVFVAERETAIVGFATYIEVPASLRLGHWWQVRDLFVSPEHRRRGIAASLLDAVRYAAAASGALRLGLQTEDGNDAAQELYRAAGYVPSTGYRNLVLPLTAQ